MTGDPTVSCRDSCIEQGQEYNTTVDSCQSPSPQPVCYEPENFSWGYQNASSDATDMSCLTALLPNTISAETVPAERATAFNCLCGTPELAQGLQLSKTCSSVPTTAVSPPPPAPVPLSASSSSSTGAIVGGVVGGIAGAALIGLALVCFVRRRKFAHSRPEVLPLTSGARSSSSGTDSQVQCSRAASLLTS